MADFLAAERRTLKANLKKLLADHRDKFVLIHGTKVEGLFTTEDEALGVGYERFGAGGAFLVQQVTETNRVAILTPFFSA